MQQQNVNPAKLQKNTDLLTTKKALKINLRTRHQYGKEHTHLKTRKVVTLDHQSLLTLNLIL